MVNILRSLRCLLYCQNENYFLCVFEYEVIHNEWTKTSEQFSFLHQALRRIKSFKFDQAPLTLPL
jgi:hypothetical protein